VPPPPGSSACHRRCPPCIAVGLLRAPLPPSSAASQCPAPADATRAPATAANLDQLAPPSAPVVHPYTAYARSRPGSVPPTTTYGRRPGHLRHQSRLAHVPPAATGLLAPLRPPAPSAQAPSGGRRLPLATGSFGRAPPPLVPPSPAPMLGCPLPAARA
jgi:hypothetical protein